jgi:hypothetical protein
LQIFAPKANPICGKTNVACATNESANAQYISFEIFSFEVTETRKVLREV